MHKIKKYLLYLLKILLFVVLVFLVYYQIKSRGDADKLWENFIVNFTWHKIHFLLIAIFLMPLNWLLESLKWRTFIVNFQEDFTYSKALKSVFCGTFFAFITPNRIGEFGGRLHKIEKEYWPKALTAGFWGGVAQFLITFSIGIYMGWKAFLNLTGFEKNSTGVFLLALAIAAFSLLVFFKLKIFITLFQKIPFLWKKLAAFEFDFNMSIPDLFKVIFITLFRYLIYVNQYIFILYFFGVGAKYSVLFAAVSAMLFFHTAFPSVPFIDIGIKGNALLFLLKGSNTNEVAIALTVIAIWIINIILPALLGYIVFLRVKSRKKQQQATATSASVQ
jgi:uncharacterized membrane protein YbhN (UPF0104 family)